MSPSVFYVDKPLRKSNGADYREAWINSLRGGDVAAVAKLYVLPRPRAGGRLRPSADFAATVAEIIGRGAILVEATSDIASNDTKQWRELLQKSAGRIAAGRGHSARKAREYGLKGGKVMRDRSIARRWLSPKMAKEREAAGRIWRDPIHENADAALAALPDELGTLSMAYRVLGKRRPNIVTGRPRSAKRN